MTTVDDYIDVRSQLDDYKQVLCPECGVKQWFRHHNPSYGNENWRCEKCGERETKSLEYPCPECDTRMQLDGDAFVCHNKDCETVTVAFDQELVLDRLSSDTFPKRAHKPGVLMGKCPLCGESNSVNGGPDGELTCDECDDFYAGQYSDEWYCYGIWMRNKDTIRVNEP